eukprot:3616420-Pyramimonas_sp.AAC.1
MKLSAGMVESGSQEKLEEIKKELAQARTAPCKRRTDLETTRTKKLAMEITSAYENNKYSEMHRPLLEYQRNGRGPKK